MLAASGASGVRVRVLIRAGIVRALGVGRDDREPRHRAGQAEGLLQQGVVQRRGGEVQLLGQHALDDQRVHRGPRRRVDPGQRERGRPVAVRTDPGDVIVDPLRVGQQRLASRAGPRRLGAFPLGGAQQPEPELELVDRQVGRAGQLGEAALAETALLVHLAQPERRVHVPEGEEDVMVGGPADRGDALGGVAHRDRIAAAPAGAGSATWPAARPQRRSRPRSRRPAPPRPAGSGQSRPPGPTAGRPTPQPRPPRWRGGRTCPIADGFCARENAIGAGPGADPPGGVGSEAGRDAAPARGEPARPAPTARPGCLPHRPLTEPKGPVRQAGNGRLAVGPAAVPPKAPGRSNGHRARVTAACPAGPASPGHAVPGSLAGRVWRRSHGVLAQWQLGAYRCNGAITRALTGVMAPSPGSFPV